jgi:hypothetical protein
MLARLLVFVPSCGVGSVERFLDRFVAGLMLILGLGIAQEVTVEREDAAAAAEEERLRYLAFVQQAAAQALVLAAAAYAHAKQGAGPLRPGVDHVEGTVRAVVGPVYHRFHAVPLDLLKFLDRKVRAPASVARHNSHFADSQ